MRLGRYNHLVSTKRLFSNILEAIGDTPMVRINRITDPEINALLTGKATKKLTITRVSESAVTVPAKDAAGEKVVFLNRLEGVIAAQGS